MYELRGHYAKWNKPDIEEQIIHDTTYILNPKIVKLRKPKSGMVVVRI